MTFDLFTARSSSLPYAFVWALYIWMGKLLRVSNDFSSEASELILFKFHMEHLREGKQKIAKIVMVRRPRWPPCPYMVKTFKNLLLHNRGCLGAESLHKSSGTRGQPKLLKELSYVDVWPFYGKVKFASLCICMSSIHLNGKIVKSFKRLLLWSLWANFVQISYGATLVWGNKRLLKLSRSVTKMAAMPIYGKNL